MNKQLKIYVLTVFLLSWLLDIGIWLQRENAFYVNVGLSLVMLIPGLVVVAFRKELGNNYSMQLGLNFGKKWRIYILSYLLPIVFMSSSYILSYFIGWADFDSQLKLLSSSLPSNIQFDANEVKIYLIVASFTWAILFNLIFAFGEEIAWRGFLYNQFKKSGATWPILKTNVIWGLWHMPLILLLGLNYPGYPYIGIFFMVISTLLFGWILCWLREKGASLFPAVLAHATVNAQGRGILPLIFPVENPLLGGATGIVGFLILLLLIFALHVVSPFEKPNRKVF